MTMEGSPTDPGPGDGLPLPNGAPDQGEPRSGVRDVQYKGGPLDADRGPGLGCFWIQVVALVVVVILTPLSAAWDWPVPVIVVLLATTLVLLLFVGQTVIFLLRLVAADRRADARRRPLGSATKTVGELEDEARLADASDGAADDAATEPDDSDDAPEDRQP